jgi:hypothetical protein
MMRVNINNEIFDEMIAILSAQDILTSIGDDESESGENQLLIRLKRLSFFDLIGIVKGSMRVDLNVNVKEMEAMVEKVERKNQIEIDFVWAVKNGATNKMLGELFPALYDESEFARLRKGLVCFKRRVQIKDESAQQFILNSWVKAKTLYADANTSSPEFFWCLKCVHEDLTEKMHELASVYAVIQEANKNGELT